MNPLPYWEWIQEVNRILTEWSGYALDVNLIHVWSEWYSGMTPRDFVYTMIS